MWLLLFIYFIYCYNYNIIISPSAIEIIQTTETKYQFTITNRERSGYIVYFPECDIYNFNITESLILPDESIISQIIVTDPETLYKRGSINIIVVSNAYNQQYEIKKIDVNTNFKLCTEKDIEYETDNCSKLSRTVVTYKYKEPKQCIGGLSLPENEIIPCSIYIYILYRIRTK